MESDASPHTGGKLILILACTLAVSIMSATMFNIVLPMIAADFGLSFSQVSWVSSAYLLVYAIGTIVYGKLADSYPLRSLLTFGLAFFALGSLFGLVARTYETVLLGRVLQAGGAAVIPAAAGIIPVRCFPPERRGRALGIMTTGMAVGSAIGPAVAALVTSLVHWRWLFCMPLLTLVLLPYYRKYLRGHRRTDASIDWIGGGLLAGTVASLLLAITNAAWPYAAGCAALFLVFVARIRSAKSPFIRPRLFRSKAYTLGLVLAFAGTCIGYSLPFVLPLLFTLVNGLAPGWVGLAMVPAAAATAMLGHKAGKLADANGNPFLFYSSASLLGLCLLSLSAFAGMSPILIALLLILGNVGYSFMYVAMTNAVSRSLSPDEAGVGMGMLSMLNFIAGAVSASLYGGIVDRGAESRWNPFNAIPEAYVFSNLYLALAAVLAIVVAVYLAQFGRVFRRGSDAKQPASQS